MTTAGRVVVITGGASGIGRATAERFAAIGDRVVIADANEAAAKAAADEVRGLAVTIDISDSSSVADGVAHVVNALGPIEVLVNNAGIVLQGAPLIELPVGVFDKVVSVNFRGTFMMTQVVGKHMVDAKTRGAIVNVSSIGARQPTPGLGHYEATKAAVDAITRSAAIELAPHGIRVNGVAPGPVMTPMTAPAMTNPQARHMWESRIPLGRIATTDDVAPLIVSLASSEFAHVTGVVLQVDGGQLLV